MATKKITMVDAMQIVRKGYKGCTSTAAVKSFCQKNHVACCWWTPQGGKRTMLIEVSSFQNAYKAYRTMNTNSTRTSSTRGNTAWAKNASTTRASNRTQSSWAKKARTQSKKSRGSSRTNRTRTLSRTMSGNTGRRIRRAA